MKMILAMMALLYFFAPPSLAGLGMRVLALMLIVRLIMDVPMLIREYFGRQRIV